LFKTLNRLSFAKSVVGRVGKFFGAVILLLRHFPLTILINEED
jgi:hypothetical protein